MHQATLPERKSTRRMKKPTQRLRKFDFNRHRRHLVLIFVVWVSLERSLWFDLSVFCLHGFLVMISPFGLISLFFVFMGFWVWPLSLVWSLCFFFIFLCFLNSCFGFLFNLSLFYLFIYLFIFVFVGFMVCLRTFVCFKFDFWVFLWNSSLTDLISMWIFIEIEFLILDLLQWTRVSYT